MGKKTVLVCGLFNWEKTEYQDYLQQAKDYGDKLIVVIATDKNIEKLLGIKPQYTEKERLAYVQQLWLADHAEISQSDDCFKNINNYKPDLVVLKAGANKLLYELSNFLFENRIKTNVLTIDVNNIKWEIHKAKKIFHKQDNQQRTSKK